MKYKLYPSGSKVCVCNMSDLFHEDIDPQDLDLVFEYMFKRKDLTFQILTEQSAEDQAVFGKRMSSLVEVERNLGGKVKIFVSIESMMSGIDLQAYERKSKLCSCWWREYS